MKIIFSSPRRKSQPCRIVTVRPVFLRSKSGYQAEYHYTDHATHENMSENRLFGLTAELLRNDFKQLNILAESGDVQILANNPDNPRIVKKAANRGPAPQSHNQEKKYLIPNNAPCDFLTRLGVMDEHGKVFQKHYSKFRQINRFLEIVEDVRPFLPASSPLRIIDFGCGKSYLTFALYHYFTAVQGMDAEITGLDLKEDVIRFCSETAKSLGYAGLKFLTGDIASFRHESADMVVSLHACDTATDFSLVKAVEWNAKVVLSVPCCQHELFSQVASPLDNAWLKHGILKDKFTELLTDGLRGLALEACGYDVSMVEFTPLEHTSKNIMIRAVRGIENHGRAKAAKEEYQRLKSYWNVSPAIDALVVDR
ncbi:MAG: SAM-dependent methyltransferase [Clostridiales bacterium]|nr:SAM-dependent methyltransferase [Clostridiales bacterium]